MREHRLAAGAPLHREAMRDALIPTGTPGLFRLRANAAPAESVVAEYGCGHVVRAEHIGGTRVRGIGPAQLAGDHGDARAAGNAHVARPAADHVEVGTTLGDIPRQGGLVYPVESVTVEWAWYCTLPEGEVQVRELA